MARKKRTYNTSGLRNQKPRATEDGTPPNGNIPGNLQAEDEDFEWHPHTHFDSLKPDFQAEEASDEDPNNADEDMEESDSEWKENEGFGSDGLQAAMLKLAIELGDDPRDEDWVPPKLRAKNERQRKTFIVLGVG